MSSNPIFHDRTKKLQLVVYVVREVLIIKKLYKSSSSSRFHERAKHIEVACHFIRENMHSLDIVIVFIRSNDQFTNIFT